jgi:chromosome segregation ATPase
MPDKEEKTVDIDTTGPGAEVSIEEEKKEAEVVETVEPVVEKEEVKEAVEEKQESGDKQQEEKPKEEEKPKQELEEYSEGVQKRIAKLTKKWREAERQKEAALEYAKGGQAELSELRSKLTKLEPNYVKAIENRVTSGLEAAKAKLTTAREAGDINAEVDAQRSIAQLTVEETRLNALKERQSQDKEKNVKTPSLDDSVKGNLPPLRS